jgi:hypothetical protein
MPEWLEVAVRTLLAVIVQFILTKLLGKLKQYLGKKLVCIHWF